MRVADFDFHLPPELIAQTPPAVRGSSRMLRMNRHSGVVADDVFASLPQWLRAGDVLVLNDSRVLAGRLYAVRGGARTQVHSPAPTGRIEVLLTGRAEGAGNVWRALVRPARKVQPGETLHFPGPDGDPALSAEVLEAGDFGERTLRFADDPDFLTVLERIGHLPLPPYIHREDSAEDRERYQTVYAEHAGSAAAPTAGLHFTPALLSELQERGVAVERLTLHVGLGTFQPVRVETLAEIELHRERYTLPETTAAAINQARADGRRVIAAGTTVTRTLEHCAIETEGRPLEGHTGETSIFLSPGHRFRVVDGLVTNFHLPQSTLLMLVAAFLGAEHGRERILAAYAHAVRERYRFFSYGDCMLIL